MKKLISLNALSNAKLPILPYKILSRSGFEKEINSFLSLYKLTTFMIRTDSDLLYSPSVNNATNTLDNHNKVIKFFDEGYIVFIMHPGDTNKNLHSLNILYCDNSICIEVVGPGFIATDLNRNNILHEHIELDPNSMKTISREVVVSDEEYTKQIEEKLLKGIQEDSYLNKYKSYIPINDQELLFIKDSIDKLIIASKDIDDNNNKNWIASLSFLDYRNKGNEPIFWDLYSLK